MEISLAEKREAIKALVARFEDELLFEELIPARQEIIGE